MRVLTIFEARNISKVLVASSAMRIDSCAFDECDHLITEDDKQLIIDEITKFCESLIAKVEEKIDKPIEYASTCDIIESMYFSNSDMQLDYES